MTSVHGKTAYRRFFDMLFSFGSISARADLKSKMQAIALGWQASAVAVVGCLRLLLDTLWILMHLGNLIREIERTHALDNR